MHKVRVSLNHLPALLTCHLIDEANGPLSMQLQRVYHDTLPWLISFSLDAQKTLYVFMKPSSRPHLAFALILCSAFDAVAQTQAGPAPAKEVEALLKESSDKRNGKQARQY